MRSVVAALVALFVATIGTVAAPFAAGASAAPISSCTSSTGTIIAVDYSHWGGPIVRGCDTSNPKRGIDLLTGTGFTTTGTQHDGPQFLCRIGNQAFRTGKQYPTPSSESCVVTPPASAYWSYWLAPAGQDRWTYSQLGAYSEAPKKGEVQLWIFGGTNIAGTKGGPTCSPASIRAGSATGCSGAGSSGRSTRPPKHRSKPSIPNRDGSSLGGSNGDGSGSSDRGGSSHGGSGGSAGHASTRTRSPSHSDADPATTPGSAARRARAKSSAAASSGGSTSGGSDSGAPGSVDASAAGQIVDAQPASTKQPSPGSAVPLVIGVGLALLLAAGGGFTMWRRRHSE